MQDTVRPYSQLMKRMNKSRQTGAHRPVFVSVLYALGVISLGVTGYFLPQNIFSCDYNDYDNRDIPTWKTDIKSLPSQEVQNWAKQWDFEDRGLGI